MSGIKLNMREHTSQQFEHELAEIRNQVLHMGGVVESQVKNAVQALIKIDGELAETVAKSDYQVNQLEVEIDEACTRILALRQPTASDLRMVTTISKTIADLERIGDEAEKIGKLATDLVMVERKKSIFKSLKHMSERVVSILRLTLDAFARMDYEDALEVAGLDAEIDDEYDGIVRKLITYMMEDPRSIKASMDVIWAARSLERIGDHATNICEYIIYIVKGKDIRHTSLAQVEKELMK